MGTETVGPFHQYDICPDIQQNQEKTRQPGEGVQKKIYRLMNRPAQRKVGDIPDQNIERLLPLVRIWTVSQRLRSNQQCGNTVR
jgi:hypothetical protein